MAQGEIFGLLESSGMFAWMRRLAIQDGVLRSSIWPPDDVNGSVRVTYTISKQAALKNILRAAYLFGKNQSLWDNTLYEKIDTRLI